MIGRKSFPADWRWEAFVVGVLLLIPAIVGATHVAGASSLGYDEAMYASKARSLVSDIPAAWWPAHRPPGLPVIGVLAAPWGFSDESLRAVTLVLGLASLFLVWALARQVWGPAAGVIALGAALGARVVLRQLPTFLNDLASAGLLVLLMLVLWDQFERRPAPNRMLLATAPIAASAFYLRYGSVLSIVVIGLIAVLLWGSSMRLHWRLVGATIGIGVLLTIPHLLGSLSATGSLTGILTSASAAANTSSPSATLRQHAQWIPTRIGGPIAWLVIIPGVVHAAILAVQGLRRGAFPPQLRRHTWVLGTAAGSALLVGIASHAEPRYALLPLLLGLVAGAGALGSVIESIDRASGLGRRAPILARTSLAVLVAILVLPAALDVRFDAATHGARARWWAEAGATIAADAGGPCRVVTSVPPLIGFYSTCEAELLADRPSAWLEDGVSVPTYVVLSDTNRRNHPSLVAAYQPLIGSGRLVALDTVPTEEADVFRAAP